MFIFITFTYQDKVKKTLRNKWNKASANNSRLASLRKRFGGKKVGNGEFYCEMDESSTSRNKSDSTENYSMRTSF